MRTKLFLFGVVAMAALAGCTKDRPTDKKEAEKYAVEVSSSKGGTAGVVVGNGQPASSAITTESARVSLSATPDKLYRFDGWIIDKGNVTFDPTSANVGFDMPGEDVAVTAQFVLNAGALYIRNTPGGAAGHFEVSSDGEAIEGGSLVEVGAILTVKAVATEEYEFLGWEIEGVDIPDADKTKTEVTFAMPENSVTIDGEFKTTHFLFTITNRNSKGGTVEVKVDEEAIPLSGSRVKAGKTVYLKCTPSEGYNFGNWILERGETVLEDVNSAETSFVMPEGPVDITAMYDAIVVPKARLIVRGTPGGAAGRFEVTKSDGTTPDQLVEVGTLLNVKAVAGEEHVFSEWAITGVDIPDADKTKTEITFAMPNSDVVIDGNFKLTHFPFSTTRVSTGGTVEVKVDGEIVPAGEKIQAGKTVYLKCTPSEKYNFGKWRVDRGAVTLTDETSAETSFVMPEEPVDIVAVYDAIIIPKFNLTVTGGTGGSYGSFVVTKSDGTTPDQLVEVGTLLNVKAVAKEGYAFGKWTITGYTVPENLMTTDEITFEMPGQNVVIRADFVRTHYNLIIYCSATRGSVEITADGENVPFAGNGLSSSIKAGASVTLKGTPAEGLKFNKWVVDNGADVVFEDASKPEVTFTMPAETVMITSMFADL